MMAACGAEQAQQMQDLSETIADLEAQLTASTPEGAAAPQLASVRTELEQRKRELAALEKAMVKMPATVARPWRIACPPSGDGVTLMHSFVRC
jgi:chromosome segregation ATPase